MGEIVEIDKILTHNDEPDHTLMMMMGSFTRRISSTWIIPSKSRMREDLARVFFKDESPEGLYPACIVTENLLDQIVVIVPMMKYKELLAAWKQTHPAYTKRLEKMLKK
jgi:hypothetical protein